MKTAQTVNRELLENRITESGLKKTFIIEKLGISRTAFDKKLKGAIPFRASEMYVIKDLCKISDKDATKIFLPKEYSNTDT